MTIDQRGVSVDLDEPIDADLYEVTYVSEVTNTKGIKYDVRYHRSHENGPDFRESIRAIVERGMSQCTSATAYCAKKNGIVLKEVNIKIVN